MYNYLITWNPDDITRKIAVKEEDILENITKVFTSVSSTNEKLLKEVTEYFQGSNKAEAEFHRAQMKALNKRALEIDEEINNLMRKSIKKEHTMSDK